MDKIVFWVSFVEYNYKEKFYASKTNCLTFVIRNSNFFAVR